MRPTELEDRTAGAQLGADFIKPRLPVGPQLRRNVADESSREFGFRVLKTPLFLNQAHAKHSRG